MSGLEIFYLVSAFAIIVAVIFIWALHVDSKEKEEEDSELIMIRHDVIEAIELIVPEMKGDDKKLLSDHMAIEMLFHGALKYKEGFDNGQQMQLHKTVDDIDPEAMEIMKNQTPPVL